VIITSKVKSSQKYSSIGERYVPSTALTNLTADELLYLKKRREFEEKIRAGRMTQKVSSREE
jgi:hypothetical protein